MKQKSACLDPDDPRAIKFPPPMSTDWEDRSDIDYDVEHINHPRKLAGDQLVSVPDRGSAPVVESRNSVGVKSRDAGAQTLNGPNKRTELLFQRIQDTNKRYRPLKQKVVSESQLTLALANGSVLSKSGVAGKTLNPTAPKFSETITPKPPMIVAVKRRADLKLAEEEKAAGANVRMTIQAGTRAK